MSEESSTVFFIKTLGNHRLLSSPRWGITLWDHLDHNTYIYIYIYENQSEQSLDIVV